MCKGEGRLGDNDDGSNIGNGYALGAVDTLREESFNAIKEYITRNESYRDVTEE